MFTRFLIIAILVIGCGTSSTKDPTVDAAASSSGDASPTSDAIGGVDGSTDSVPPYACAMTGDGTLFSQCCVFGSNACGSGLTCYWQNHDVMTPTQDGGCFTAGAIQTGLSCSGQESCVVGDYCVPNAFVGVHDGGSVCRQICDPDDLAGHGCGPTHTCIKMSQCFDNGTCPPAPAAHIGWCM